MPDTEALKRKYAEIAQLKRQIDAKIGIVRAFATLHVRPGLAPSKIISKIALSKNRLQVEYIVDEKRKTLMTPRAMKKQKELLQQRVDEAARLRAQAKLQKDAQRWLEQLSRNGTKTDSCDRVSIEGESFAVTGRGDTLVPLSGPKPEIDAAVQWAGWTYTVAASGVLKRVVSESKSHSFPVQREQCRYFSRNGMLNICSRENLLTSGVCAKGSRCPFVHDMSRIKLCRHYLAGKCLGSCIMCHQANEFNTPLCQYFLEGKCLNAACRYLHRPPPQARLQGVSVWTCRPFAVGGWCDRGDLCPFLHLYKCPDFEESAVCPRGKKCTLMHPVTRRIQEMMATPSEVNGVLVADQEPGTTVVSSYTVDPSVLFVLPGTYDYYIDERSDNRYTIELDLSDDDIDEPSPHPA